MMMSLSLSALTAAVLSPSRHPCMVKLPPVNGDSYYRIDPYSAAVLPPIDVSPQFINIAPIAARRARPTPSPPPMAPPLTTSVIPKIAPTTAVPVAAAAPQQLVAAAERIVTESRPHFAVVKFKHDFVWFAAPFKISVGDCVAVEGDRGENIGTVEEITTEKPDYPVTQSIVRHASNKDKDHVAMLRRKEAAATKTCQELADSVGLNIRVVDTEYQYDMNKLTVFFASKVPVDFRKFQRELFREFRCRIWIVNWPRKPLHAHASH